MRAKANRSLYLGMAAIRPPRYIERAIRRVAGVNVFGEPLYRLVRTEGRKMLVVGKWTDWARGTPLVLRNPEDPRCRPVRRVVEERLVPIYPGEHTWALERWAHPDRFGTPYLWKAVATAGGNNLGGEFPMFGDYEDANFFFTEEQLSEKMVVTAIEIIESGLAQLPSTPYQRILLAATMDEEAERKKEAAFDAWAMDVLNDEGNVMGARTPGGKAEMHRLAESIGIRSQI